MPLPRRHSWGPALLKLCLAGFTSPFSLPSLFQIVRKIVRQIDSSGADDTQEHEEVIIEGPPEDPREMEADIDDFMKHAKVLQWPQSPEALALPRGLAAPLPAAHLCASPAGVSDCTLPTSLSSPLSLPYPEEGSVFHTSV